MACDYVKNLIIDKENNKITGYIADGNISPLTYYKREMYQMIPTFEEKYASLIRSIISGMLHFSDTTNELYKISFDSPYDLREIRNYYNDISVLGEVDTYKKYKNKIEEIIKFGTNKRELHIIPSVYEERFILNIVPEKLNNNLAEMCGIFTRMETVFENRNDLTKQDKVEMLDEVLKGFDMKNKPIFELIDKENEELKVYIYPVLKESINDNAYLSYDTIVKNNNHQLRYKDSSMMIGYLTNPGDENRIKQYMYEMGKKFEQDISPFMIDANDLADLQWKAKDNYFYENYRSPLIAIRENGNILEITKEKGKLISSLYSSNNNIDKCELISKRTLQNEFDLDKIQSIDEVKKNCYRLIVTELENEIENISNDDESEEEYI